MRAIAGPLVLCVLGCVAALSGSLLTLAQPPAGPRENARETTPTTGSEENRPQSQPNEVQREFAPPADLKPVSGPGGLRLYRNLEFAKPDGHSLKLDIGLPKEGQGPWPVVVWIHGGGWEGGNKENPPLLPVVAKGFVGVSISYRLTHLASFPAQIQDCKAAIRWLRAFAKEFQLDAERIGVWGASAGGHLAALLGTAGDEKDFDVGPNRGFSSRVQAVCDFFGPADLVRIVDDPKGVLDHTAANGPVGKLLGGPPRERQEMGKKASPTTYASAGDPPFLIFHGDKDNVVHVNQSRYLHEALTQANVPSTLEIVAGAGHGFTDVRIVAKVIEFFEKHLKPAPK